MKNILLTFLFIFQLYAAPVLEQDILSIADNVISNKFPNNTGYVVSNIDVVSELGSELIYIVNVNPVGFILISADDRLYPLLGYSYESNFTNQNFPSQFEALFNSYKDQISSAILENIQRDQYIEEVWNKYKTSVNIHRDDRSVAPLLSARWNQGNPYNDMCPVDFDGPGGNALVGCVAVSMVQVMHYWSYPEYGFGSHSYYHNNYGQLSANFNTFYDFDNMPNTTGTIPVQLLSYHAGVAVEMGYGADGSGAWVGSGYPCAMTAMRDHFLYNDDMQFRYKSSYNWNSWRNLLKDELDSGRPLIYRGYSNSGGHAWNIDGYDDDLFHNNWGWGGSYNGFYYINELNAGGDSYTGDMAVIVNIEPESLTEPNLVLNTHFSNEVSGDMDGVLNPGESAQVYVSINNLIPWPEAENVDAYLATEEDNISIISGSFLIDQIGSGGEYINENNPFLIYILPEAEIRDYSLSLILSGTSSNGEIYVEEYPFELNVSLNQANFPIVTNIEIIGSPIAIDINNDNEKEVIFVDNSGTVQVINKNGNSMWSYTIGDDVWGSPAIDDLDNDGDLELVVTSKTKELYIFDHLGNPEVIYDSNQFLMGTPVICNIDNDDEKEIVFAGFSSSGDVFALNHDGSTVSGFPCEVNEKIREGGAVYDFNNNGKDDIVFATESENKILVVYDDGTSEDFLTSNYKFKNAPSILDIDGNISILAGDEGGNLYSINSEGDLNFTYLADGAITTAISFTNFSNSTVGIFFGTETGGIYAIDQFGNNISGWPIFYNGSINSTPSFFDLNNDNFVEIVSSTVSGNILVLNMDGSNYNHFPINYLFGTNSSPMITDLDGDMDMELIYGMTGGLTILDIKEQGSATSYWNMYRGDLKRTGLYTSSFSNSNLGDLNADETIDILDIVITINIILEVVVPTNYQFIVGDINSDSVIDILDIVQLINLILE